MNGGYQQGGCPETGAHDVDGKLYIGKYPFKKWIDESVKPCWGEIRAARERNRGNDGYCQRCEKEALEVKISEMNTTKARLEADISAVTVDHNSISALTSSNTQGSRAGESFGGRAEKHNLKKGE